MKYFKTSLMPLWNRLPIYYRYAIQICVVLSVLNACLIVIQGFSSQQYFPNIDDVALITVSSENSDDKDVTFEKNDNLDFVYNNLIIYSRFRLWGQRDENWKMVATLTLHNGSKYIVKFSDFSVSLNGIVKPLYYQSGKSISVLNKKIFS